MLPGPPKSLPLQVNPREDVANAPSGCHLPAPFLFSPSLPHHLAGTALFLQTLSSTLATEDQPREACPPCGQGPTDLRAHGSPSPRCHPVGQRPGSVGPDPPSGTHLVAGGGSEGAAAAFSWITAQPGCLVALGWERRHSSADPHSRLTRARLGLCFASARLSLGPSIL